MNEYNPSEQTPEERYDNMVAQVMADQHCSRRQARRYVDKLARKAHEDFMREAKARRAKLEAEGKLIDTSDLKDQLEAEFEAELAAEGLTKEDLEKLQEEGRDFEVDYKPITKEF